MSNPPIQAIQAIQVIALADAIPRYQAEVYAILREVAQLSRQEEGCLRYDVYADADKPHRINTIELWATPEALDRHFKSVHVKRAVSMLMGKMAGIPQFRVLKPVDELNT